MAMVDLALNAGEKPVPLADVAQRQKISLSYLEQLIAKLKKNGLVKSMRGPGGGYILAKSADQIAVEQVVTAVDTAREKAQEGDTQSARFMTDHLWDKVADEVHKYLRSVTLADVVQRKI